MKVVTSVLLDDVAGVRHAFFTRHGGVSTGLYDSLNVGRGSKDEPAGRGREPGGNTRFQSRATQSLRPRPRFPTCLHVEGTGVDR